MACEISILVGLPAFRRTHQVIDRHDQNVIRIGFVIDGIRKPLDPGTTCGTRGDRKGSRPLSDLFQPFKHAPKEKQTQAGTLRFIPRNRSIKIMNGALAKSNSASHRPLRICRSASSQERTSSGLARASSSRRSKSARWAGLNSGQVLEPYTLSNNSSASCIRSSGLSAKACWSIESRVIWIFYKLPSRPTIPLLNISTGDAGRLGRMVQNRPSC